MALAVKDRNISAVVQGRLAAMHEFISTMDGWYGQMLKVAPATLMTLVKLGTRVVTLLKFLGRKGGAEAEP